MLSLSASAPLREFTRTTRSVYFLFVFFCLLGLTFFTQHFFLLLRNLLSTSPFFSGTYHPVWRPRLSRSFTSLLGNPLSVKCCGKRALVSTSWVVWKRHRLSLSLSPLSPLSLSLIRLCPLFLIYLPRRVWRMGEQKNCCVFIGLLGNLPHIKCRKEHASVSISQVVCKKHCPINGLNHLRNCCDCWSC